MLNPEQLKAIRERIGIQAPTTPVDNVISTRETDLQNAWGSFEPEKPVEPQKSLIDKAGEFLTSTGPSFKASEGGFESLSSNLAKTAGNIPSSTRDIVKNVIAPVNPFDTESPVNIGKNIVESVKAGYDTYKQQGPLEGTKSILGGFADTYLKIGETIYGGLDKAYNALLDDPKKAIADTVSHISKIGIEDPMLVPSLLYGGPKATGAKTDIIATVGGEAKNIASDVSNIADRNIVKPVANIVKSSSAAKTAQRADDLAGKIVQGTPEDIQKAKAALQDIDLDGVKKYPDLKEALNDKVSTLASKLDERLEQSPIREKPLKLSQWDKITKIGDQTVSHNYVQDALDQLETHFSNINDIENATKIKQLIAKGESEGFTIKEVNDIARMHGENLNAFNANGELSSGLKKQAVENTRKGVKDTAREAFNDPVYSELDKQMSDTIRVRSLVDDMSEEVNKLRQKVSARGFGEKVGRLAFNVIDMLSGKSLSGFLRAGLVPRGGGLKTMNALDLESQLTKNLKNLQKALNSSSEDEAYSALNNIIKDDHSTLPANQLNTNNAANTTKNVSIINKTTPFTPKSKTGQMIKSAIDNSNPEGGYIRNPLASDVEGISKDIPSSEISDSVINKIPSSIRDEAMKVYDQLNDINTTDQNVLSAIDEYKKLVQTGGVGKEELNNAKEIIKNLK